MAEPRFIEITDFVGKISLSQKTTGFDNFAAQSEDGLLLMLLNAKLYNEFIADLDGNNVPQTQKFIDLLNGKTYQNEGTLETINYLGLKDLIKYYVFCEIQIDSYSFPTQLGNVIPEIENATVLQRRQLRLAVNAKWNEFIRKYKQAIYYIDNEYETYFPDTNDFINWEPKKLQTRGRYKTNNQNNYYYLKNKSRCLNNCK